MRKAVLPLLMALALLGAGCFPIDWAVGGDEPPTTSVPGDQRGPVYIDSVDLLMLESWPVQVHALIKGNLPTPCHTLAWHISGPDADGRIVLDLYSGGGEDEICVEVLQPFEQSIPIGSFTSGSFVLVINGVEYPFNI